ncbi:MAG: MGMT family protein [Christensenellales bacterium]|jgi:methylated-DNA-protein-cysteine methyltransferase-like protein
MKFFESVYEAVKLIPRGKVSTYGDIARMVGRPRHAKFVGYALHVNPDNSAVPCHRVVRRDGSLSEAFKFGGKEIHKMLLEKEGVKVSDDYKVDLDTYKWHFLSC